MDDQPMTDADREIADKILADTNEMVEENPDSPPPSKSSSDDKDQGDAPTGIQAEETETARVGDMPNYTPEDVGMGLIRVPDPCTLDCLIGGILEQFHAVNPDTMALLDRIPD